MSDCQDKHGWKWIGAPQNGVLGLLPASPPTDTDRTNQQLHNEPPHTTSESVQDDITHPPPVPLAIRVVFLVMELVMAHAAGMLFVWCGSITKTIARNLTGSSVLAETLYCAVVCYGVLFFTAKFFQQRDLALFTKRLGLMWTPAALILLSVAIHSLLLLFFLSLHDHQPLWSLPPDDQSMASALRVFIFAPLQEELFFRGLVLHIALNRLEDPRRKIRSHEDLFKLPFAMVASVFVSSVCFAGVHLANLRHGDAVDVSAQLVWGLGLGIVWGMRVVMRGSLLECVALHTINNVFAALLSTAMQEYQLSSLFTGVLMLMVHFVAMNLQW